MGSIFLPDCINQPYRKKLISQDALKSSQREHFVFQIIHVIFFLTFHFSTKEVMSLVPCVCWCVCPSGSSDNMGVATQLSTKRIPNLVLEAFMPMCLSLGAYVDNRAYVVDQLLCCGELVTWVSVLTKQ